MIFWQLKQISTRFYRISIFTVHRGLVDEFKIFHHICRKCITYMDQRMYVTIFLVWLVRVLIAIRFCQSQQVTLNIIRLTIISHASFQWIIHSLLSINNQEEIQFVVSLFFLTALCPFAGSRGSWRRAEGSNGARA